jgi:multiple sugar transport system substrate-binding protein
MKKRLYILPIILLVVVMVVTSVGVSSAQPRITINWATIAGFYTDWAAQVAADYEAATGVDINIIDIDFPQLYQNQVLESVANTGAYDILTYDVGWKAEFSENGYLLPIDDFVAADARAQAILDDIHPALLETTSRWRGQTFGLPYYTFTMGYFYRCDLFEDPGEQAAFLARYGYPLSFPRTYYQMADIAEFFRRQAGESLAGVTLERDFYGIGLMAGRFPHVQDEINTIAWTWGARVINDDGTPGTLSYTFLSAVALYVNDLLPYAPPGATSSAFDEVVAQMRQGLIAQTGPLYLDQYPNVFRTQTEVPGARICTAPTPGAHTWVGAFGLGVSPDSANPEAAFDFISWLAGPEAQRRFAIGGGSSALQSILSDSALIAENPATMGHYPTLLMVLDHAEESNFYPNYYFVPQGGKIYDEMTTYYSAAASGQQSILEAMTNFAQAVERLCGGPCEVANDALGEGYRALPMPFPYERYFGQ